MSGPGDYRLPVLAGRLVEALVLSAALVALAWVIAHWGWRWLGPDPAASPQSPLRTDVAIAARAIAGAHLFGEAPAVSDAPPVAAYVPGSADIRPIGVFAEAGGKGEALLKVGAKPPMLVRVGGEIEPGVVLRAVEPNAVVIADGRGERRIELRPTLPATPAPMTPGAAAASARSAAQPAALPSGSTSQPPAATPRSAPVPRAASQAGAGRAVGGARPADARSAACAQPASASSELYLLRGELLGGIIRDPGTLKALIAGQDGAVAIAASSGFAALLGLQPGDRLERANGVALRSYEDVAAQVLRPVAASERVSVTGSRAGERREWIYVNAATCAGG
jgi:hypothetical protein